MYYSHFEAVLGVIDFIFIIMNKILSFVCYTCIIYIYVLYTAIWFCVLSKIWRCANCLQVFKMSLWCTFAFSHEKPYGQLKLLVNGFEFIYETSLHQLVLDYNTPEQRITKLLLEKTNHAPNKYWNAILFMPKTP